MKHRIIFLLTVLVFNIVGGESLRAQQNIEKKDEIIFIWGGDINLEFIQYVSDLTKKENPTICYLPTASADHSDNIKYWENICNT